MKSFASFPFLLTLFLCSTGSYLSMAQTTPPPGFIVQKEWPNYYEGDVLLLNFFEDSAPEGDYLDVVISGLRAPLLENSPVDPPYTAAFRHFFNDTGEEVRPTFEQAGTLGNIFYSSLAPADFDNDGDIDLLIAGATRVGSPYNPSTQLYRNIGDRFDFIVSLQIDPPFADLYHGSADWGDYDNDGDLDLLLTGLTAIGTFTTALYRNDGDDIFVEVSTTLPNVGHGHGSFGDYDNDGDLDLLLTGSLESGSLYTAIHRNTGGTFEEALRLTPGLGFSEARWLDYDADGRLDVLLVGGLYSPFVMSGTTRLLRNTGDDAFEEVPFAGGAVFGGDVEVGDLDNDGDLDAMIGGARHAPSQDHLTQVFLNHDGTFESLSQIQRTVSASFTFGDWDDDGDLDIFITGFADILGLDPPTTLFYLNTRAQTNNINVPPSAPGDLRAEVEGRRVNLSWAPATDDTTPAAALSYNLRVGTTPGGIDVMSPQSHLDTGRRFVVERGNAGSAPHGYLDNLPPGTYYWSVQAIDNGYAGSAFAEEGSFTISAAGEEKATNIETEPTGLATPTLAPGYPNPFREQTVLRCTLPQATHAHLLVYDLLGRHVRTLRSGLLPAGSLDVPWDGRDDAGNRMAGGVYLVRLETATGYVQTQMVTVLR